MSRPAGTVESPCISVCVMDETRGYCRGCWRTRDEIARWGIADDAERLAILEQLRQRRRAAGVTSERDRRRDDAARARRRAARRD